MNVGRLLMTMSKAVLISIKPKYVKEILNHNKSIEIRKSAPKCKFPIDVYIYCTREAPQLSKGSLQGEMKQLNGKVVAKFTLHCADEIYLAKQYITRVLSNIELCRRACLTEDDLFNYLRGWRGYAWYISNLEIFNEPKPLSEFKVKHFPQYAGFVKNQTHYELVPLAKAPQSWCYIEI